MTRSRNGESGLADDQTALFAPRAPGANGTRNHCRIRRHQVSAHVHVEGVRAHQVLRHTVPVRGRERRAPSRSDFTVYGSHLARLVAAMEKAGVEVDDEPVLR